MKLRKTKIKELYLENKGVKVLDFSHPHSRKPGKMAFGVVCGYCDENLIVKLTNCEGWSVEGITKAKIKVTIEKESLNHKNGYWFISEKELEELAVDKFKA